MFDPKDYLAQTLKSVRKEKGLSLDKTAQMTGVSKAMLGQIERGESSPTLAILWKIATGLEVPMSVFIEPVPKSGPHTLIRDANVIRQKRGDEGVKVSTLFPFEERFGFEYSEVTYSPGYERLAEPHEKGVVEHISVIEGEVEIFSEGSWHPLHKGQSIRFSGDRSHGYRNRGLKDAVVIILIHYPYRSIGAGQTK